MPLELELPDGTVITDIPDGMTYQQFVDLVGYDPMAMGPNDTPRPGFRSLGTTRREPTIGERVIGAGEAALTTVTGATGGLVGQVGGFLGGLAGAVRTGEFGTAEGAQRVQQVTQNSGSRLTYAPRTEQGNVQARAVGEAFAATAPLTPIMNEIAAVTAPAVQYGRARAAPIVQRGTQAVRRATSGAVDATARVAARRVAPDRLRAAEAAAALEESPGNPGVLVAPEVAAAERAATYARDRLGVDLDRLPAAIQADLKAVARDATALEGLDPAALRRQAVLQGLPVPVPATRGDLTRDLSQITQEQNIVKTEAGLPIRNVRAEQDVALPANLDTLRGMGRVQTRQGMGDALQGALRAKKLEVARNRRELYRQAEEAGATLAPADATALDVWLQDPTRARNTRFLARALKDYRRDGTDGRIRINDLERIREEATAAAREPTTRGFYAGQARAVIDDILDEAAEQLPEGNPYRAARRAYRAEKAEFDRQGRIKALVTEKGMSTDRAVALEDTLDYVLRSSADDIREIRRSLTSGGTAATRRQGAQAWRDLRVGVLERLKAAGVGRRDIPGESQRLPDGTTAPSASQFNSSFLDLYNDLRADGKIDALFAPKERQLLDQIAESVRITRTTPSGRIAGSPTVSNAFAAMERLISRLPIGSDLARGVISKVSEMREAGQQAAQAQSAVTPPLSEAARVVPQPRKPTLAEIMAAQPQPPKR